KTQTDRPVKATCPGPVTLSIHVQLRPGDAYGNDRLALCWDFVPAINAELRALVEVGADYIQIDEPSAAIVPGQIDEYVKMFNACVEGVRARIAYHVCFGNLLSRPRGKRSYRWMFPALLDTRCHQFVFEYANREMAEIEHWKEIRGDPARRAVRLRSGDRPREDRGPHHPRRRRGAGRRCRAARHRMVGRAREQRRRDPRAAGAAHRRGGVKSEGHGRALSQAGSSR